MSSLSNKSGIINRVTGIMFEASISLHPVAWIRVTLKGGDPEGSLKKNVSHSREGCKSMINRHCELLVTMSQGPGYVERIDTRMQLINAYCVMLPDEAWHYLRGKEEYTECNGRSDEYTEETGWMKD